MHGKPRRISEIITKLNSFRFGGWHDFGCETSKGKKDTAELGANTDANHTCTKLKQKNSVRYFSF